MVQESDGIMNMNPISSERSFVVSGMEYHGIPETILPTISGIPLRSISKTTKSDRVSKRILFKREVHSRIRGANETCAGQEQAGRLRSHEYTDAGGAPALPGANEDVCGTL
jgi:hypothetical protein